MQSGPPGIMYQEPHQTYHNQQQFQQQQIPQFQSPQDQYLDPAGPPMGGPPVLATSTPIQQSMLAIENQPYMQQPMVNQQHMPQQHMVNQYNMPQPQTIVNQYNIHQPQTMVNQHNMPHANMGNQQGFGQPNVHTQYRMPAAPVFNEPPPQYTPTDPIRSWQTIT